MGSRKIILNKCFGGFGISDEAVRICRAKGAEWALKCTLPGEAWNPEDTDILGKIKSKDSKDENYPQEARTCPHFIELVEQNADLANGMCAELFVTFVYGARDIDWWIKDNDGQEEISFEPEW